MFEAMSSSNRQLTSVKPCLFDQRANGLLLCVGFLAAIILIGLGSAAVWGAIVGAALNQRLVGTFGGVSGVGAMADASRFRHRNCHRLVNHFRLEISCCQWAYEPRRHRGWH
jgi:hypothetical protein